MNSVWPLAFIALNIGCGRILTPQRSGAATSARSPLTSFRETIVEETYKLTGHENLRLEAQEVPKFQFALGYGSPDDPSPASSDDSGIKRKSCGTGTIFTFEPDGILLVAICDTTKEFTQKDVDAAKSSNVNLASMLEIDEKKRDEWLKSLGPVVHRELPPGLEMDYFPVVLVGHGSMTLWTVVVTRKETDRAVVLQFGEEHYCEGNRSARLCADTMGLLTELTLHLAQRAL